MARAMGGYDDPSVQASLDRGAASRDGGYSTPGQFVDHGKDSENDCR